MILFWFYLFFVRPHLDSATPLRDIAHSVLTLLLPIVLSMTLVIWPTRRLWRHYATQPLAMPEKWTQNIPAETMRAIYVTLAAIVGSTLLSLFVFLLFVCLAGTGFVVRFRQPEQYSGFLCSFTINLGWTLSAVCMVIMGLRL